MQKQWQIPSLQKKRARQTVRKTEVNSRTRSRVKTAVRAARDAIAGKNSGGVEALRAAASSLAKAANKGVLHKNAMARRISRLMKAASKAAKATVTEVTATTKKKAPSRAPAAKKSAAKKSTAKKK